jgi:hypothetical protein
LKEAQAAMALSNGDDELAVTGGATASIVSGSGAGGGAASNTGGTRLFSDEDDLSDEEQEPLSAADQLAAEAKALGTAKLVAADLSKALIAPSSAGWASDRFVANKQRELVGE